MGYSPEDVTYVRSVISESCAEIGPDTKEVEVRCLSECTFDPDAKSVMAFGLGLGTHRAIMVGTEGRRIPEEYKPLPHELHDDTFDLKT